MMLSRLHLPGLEDFHPSGSRSRTQLEDLDKMNPSVAMPEEIFSPTLIIYGSRDNAYDGHRVADYFARLNTQDKELIVIPDSGHFLFLQKLYKEKDLEEL